MSIITISREYGAGGHSIGKQVAQALGIEIYDKDIIRNTVRDSGLDASVIEHEEEEISRADAIWRFITPAAYTDRREAIRTAVALAKKGDIILLAGKGHEDYQIIKGEKRHFDDKEELTKALKEK